MRKISTFSRCFLNYSFAVITSLSLFYSSETQAQCVGVTVTTPTLDVRGSNNLCNGGRLEVCPLVWGYSNYQWFKDGVAFSTSSCIDITDAGSYTLAGQDGGGCWSAQSTAVIATGGIAPATPTVTAGSSTTFCGGGSVLLTSSATIGNQWNKDGVAIGGATLQTYTATESGIYTVSVMGCSSSTSTGTTVTVTAAPIVTAIIGATNACVGSTLTLVDTTTGGTWASSNTSIATVSGGIVTAIAAGTDTITYTITSGGCTTTVSQVITISSVTTPTLDVRGSTTLCGDSVQVCPLVWGYSNYQWYKDGVAFSTASCIYISTAGSYTLTGTNGNGCWSSASTAVVVTTGTAPAIPTVTAGGAITFCGGGSVVLRSSSSTANQWYKDSIAIGGATDSTYTATASGVYTVAVVGCGSSLSAGTTVTATAAPIVTAIIGSTNACVGSTLTLVDTTIGGTWASSNTSIATVSAGVVTAIATGTDTITYTKTNGSCTTTVSQIITISAVTTPTLDVRGSTVLCGSTVLQICPATYGYSNYQWYKNDVAIAAPTGTGACINIDTAALGSYTLKGTNSNGCLSSASTAVVVTLGTPPATPTVTAGGATTFCGGGSVQITSSATTDNQWNKDGVAIGGATSTTYTATTSGVYTVSAIGCGKSTSTGTTVTATVAPIVPAIIGSTNACAGSTVTLTDTATGGTWASSNTSIATVSGGVVTAIAAGTDTITYTKTLGSCTTTVSKIITLSAATTPTLDIRGSVNICGSGSLQMCPLNWGYSNYQWYKDGVPYSTASCITVNTAGAYTLAGTNGSGCWSAQSTPAVITLNPIPTMVATTGSTNVCAGSSITLTNNSSIPSGGVGIWSTGYTSQVSVGASTGIVSALNAGNVVIKYTVTSLLGCTNYTNYNVTINAIPGVPSITYAPGTVNPQAGAPTGSFCANRTFTVVGTPSGGVWSKTGVINVTTPAGVVSTGGVAGAGTLKYSYTDGNGCANSRTMSGNVYICAARGITTNEKLETTNEFSMYPNPAKSQVSINVETLVGTSNIVVTDLYGKVVKSQTLSMGTNTINISKLSAGMYFVSIITSEGKQTKKLIVE